MHDAIEDGETNPADDDSAGVCLRATGDYRRVQDHVQAMTTLDGGEQRAGDEENGAPGEPEQESLMPQTPVDTDEADESPPSTAHVFTVLREQRASFEEMYKNNPGKAGAAARRRAKTGLEATEAMWRMLSPHADTLTTAPRVNPSDRVNGRRAHDRIKNAGAPRTPEEEQEEEDEEPRKSPSGGGTPPRTPTPSHKPAPSPAPAPAPGPTPEPERPGPRTHPTNTRESNKPVTIATFTGEGQDPLGLRRWMHLFQMKGKNEAAILTEARMIARVAERLQGPALAAHEAYLLDDATDKESWADFVNYVSHSLFANTQPTHLLAQQAMQMATWTGREHPISFLTEFVSYAQLGYPEYKTNRVQNQTVVESLIRALPITYRETVRGATSYADAHERVVRKFADEAASRPRAKAKVAPLAPLTEDAEDEHTSDEEDEAPAAPVTDAEKVKRNHQERSARHVKSGKKLKDRQPFEREDVAALQQEIKTLSGRVSKMQQTLGKRPPPQREGNKSKRTRNWDANGNFIGTCHGCKEKGHRVGDCPASKNGSAGTGP
jgi:hypothetical protein